MNYELWVEAEKFLYDSLLFRVIFLLIIFTFLVDWLWIRGLKNSKRFNIIFSTMAIIGVAFAMKTGIDYKKYRVLYDCDQYVNYGIRDVKKIIRGYDYPNYQEKIGYRGLYLLENFRGTTIYDEESVEDDDVEFLGRNGDEFYIRTQNNIHCRELGDHLEIVDDIEEAKREGVKFKLKDPRYQEIGFKEEAFYIHLLTYKIPKSMENKQVENLESIETSEQSEIISGWINPTSTNQILKFKKKK